MVLPMDTETPIAAPVTPLDAARRRPGFTCRLPLGLQARMDTARWRMRLPSRQAIITRAIEEWLARHAIEIERGA